jgi:quinol monooxygenase YgiN
MQLRLRTEERERFLRAYEAIRWTVAEVPGHLVDELCQSIEDPDAWLLTSEWESAEHFLSWERTTSHRELAGPMMACTLERRSLRYAVHAVTATQDSHAGLTGPTL